MDETTHQPQDLISRRSVMFKGAALGVGATAVGRLLVDPPDVFAKTGHTKVKGGRLTKGDAAILRFLAAAEIIESDLWQQYNELAGIQDREVPGGSGNDAYTEAVEVLDEDMNQYIHDNTDDEFSHVAFINAYLKAHGEKTVNLDKFRTLPSSQADGAQKNVGRLTNLMQLSVDTSFWTRYRSDTLNPDLGDTLPQAVPTLAVGQHPAIPRDNSDLNDANHLQAIANTAGFHFAFIEQGGTSLYAVAGAAGHQQGGASNPAQHRRQRDHALPDLARQGRERASAHRRRIGVPGPQCRRRVDPDQPDHARADEVPAPEVPGRLDHPADRDQGRGDGRGQGAYPGRAVHRAAGGVLCGHQEAGKGRRRCPARAIGPRESQTRRAASEAARRLSTTSERNVP